MHTTLLAINPAQDQMPSTLEVLAERNFRVSAPEGLHALVAKGDTFARGA